MQWYFESLVMLLVLVGAGALTGALVLAPLPARMQPGARVFLSVPLGWAALTLVTTLFGWFGHGFRGWHCAVITGALSAAGAWTGRRWLRHAGGDAVRLAVFCLLASFPILGSLLYIGAFNTYNDTFIYMCHAQWLQDHSAMVPASTAGGHPAWAAVLIFQDAHLRMGTSFLLSWVQSIFGREFSYEVYPVVAALGVICGALGTGATLLAACPGRWIEAWLTALAAAVTVNGFAFGAASGFLPQTWGLAFAAAAFALRGLEMGSHAERSGRALWKTDLPLSICVAASMYCYWDLLPLEGPALAMTYFVPWPGRDGMAWRQAWKRAGVPALLCVLLVNVEWLRAIPGILVNTRLVVANPVRWQVWDFPAHALGLKSSVWERSLWITRDSHKYLMWIGCGALLTWLAVMLGVQRRALWRRWRRLPGRGTQWRVEPLIPALVWVGLTTALCVYFRYWVASPWREENATGFPDGVGQSWSQYKLTIWSSLACISLAAAMGTAWMRRRPTLLRRGVLTGLLVVWCGTGLGWNGIIVDRRGHQLLLDTGMRKDPFAVCLTIRRQLASLPPDAWIYLDWPPAIRARFCELMGYFLYDHPLASDWSREAYPNFRVILDPVHRSPADCEVVLEYRPPEDVRKYLGAATNPGWMVIKKGKP